MPENQSVKAKSGCIHQVRARRGAVASLRAPRLHALLFILQQPPRASAAAFVFIALHVAAPPAPPLAVGGKNSLP